MKFNLPERTIEDIAIEAGHRYAKDITDRQSIPKDYIYAELKEAYMRGFIRGFTHKMSGGHES